MLLCMRFIIIPTDAKCVPMRMMQNKESKKNSWNFISNSRVLSKDISSTDQTVTYRWVYAINCHLRNHWRKPPIETMTWYDEMGYIFDNNRNHNTHTHTKKVIRQRMHETMSLKYATNVLQLVCSHTSSSMWYHPNGTYLNHVQYSMCLCVCAGLFLPSKLDCSFWFFIHY